MRPTTQAEIGMGVYCTVLGIHKTHLNVNVYVNVCFFHGLKCAKDFDRLLDISLVYMDSAKATQRTSS